jgi:UDP-hydrolysing UDP-N-acetyl-D-glucosamine 2-epimerase
MGMGEHPERIYSVGAPDLDMVRMTEPLDIDDLLKPLQLSVEDPFLLVTVHPETNRTESETRAAMNEFFIALTRRPEQILITGPGMEYESHIVFDKIEQLVDSRPAVAYVKSLGAVRYINAMRYAAAIVGNSSSGIVESSFFPVPTVNVGDRQRGRLRGGNVIDCAWNSGEIDMGIDMALSKEFKERIKSGVSPYGDGHAAEQIADLSVKHAGRIALDKPFFAMDL